MSPSHSFLLASWGGPGNLGPMLTAARRLRRSGHRIRIIADADMCDEVDAAGFPFVAWRLGPSYADLGSATAALDASDLRVFCDRAMFGPASAYAADTRQELDRVPTDALLANDLLIGSALAAEAVGIPCAMLSPHISLRPLPGIPPVASGLLPAQTPEEHAEVDAANRRLADSLNEFLPVLNEARARLGLSPLNHVLDIYDRPERVLLGISGAFDFPATSMPANVRYVGPLLDPPGWSKAWTAPWSEPFERPRALVSFSTTFQNQAGALQRVMNALGQLDIDVVATTGPALVGTVFDAPKNVTLLHSAPHDAVMKEISLVVTHGGHGTVCRALARGLPLLVMPMGRDQNDNALRVVAHGAGLSLPPTATEAEIFTALQRLTTESHFREAAGRLGNTIAADLDSSCLVREMEAIVAFGKRADLDLQIMASTRVRGPDRHASSSEPVWLG